MELIRKNNETEALEEAADACNSLLQENAGIPVLFLFSGGSALKILSKIDAVNLDSNITFAPLDERFSFDEKVNNFLQVMFLESFYATAVENGCAFISTYPEQMQTMEETADAFEVSLRKWRRENPKGVVIATVGIGPDGHTSGIMPYPENPTAFLESFENVDRWVVAYDALDKNEYPLRITTTLHFMRAQIDHAVVFVCGSSKTEALKRVIADEGTLANTPARILREMKDVRVFTDIDLK